MSDEQTIGIILARKGSKGIPRKNLQLVDGLPLIHRAIGSLSKAVGISCTYVSTDDDQILEISKNLGAQVIERPLELAVDTATSESALLHALSKIEEDGLSPRVLAFIQCTSPFISPEEIGIGVSKIKSGDYDSVFCASRSDIFLWREDKFGTASGINHVENNQRVRRQDRQVEFRETGSFYIMNIEGFKQYKNRFFGRIGLVESYLPAIDIDEEIDLIVANALAKKGSV